jgi:hypothetical protein
MLKTLLIGAIACAAAVAPAQWYSGTQYSYGGYGGGSYHQPCYQPVPQIIYVGGTQGSSRRTPSNVPFAYGSFFYGQSWQDWQQSQNRRLR